MKNSYKKSYKGFIIWLVLFLVINSFVPIVLSGWISSEKLLTLITLMLCLIFLDILMYMIYDTEFIYWFTGWPDYETAAKMTSEQRKAYAWKHLKVFLTASVLFLIVSIISLVMQFHIWVDILVWGVVVCAAAISTVRIKPEA